MTSSVGTDSGSECQPAVHDFASAEMQSRGADEAGPAFWLCFLGTRAKMISKKCVEVTMELQYIHGAPCARPRRTAECVFGQVRTTAQVKA